MNTKVGEIIIKVPRNKLSEFYTSFLSSNKTRFESTDNTVVNLFKLELTNNNIAAAIGLR